MPTARCCCSAFPDLLTFLEPLGISWMGNNCIFYATSVATVVSNKLPFSTIQTYVQYRRFLSFKSVRCCFNPLLFWNLICVYIYFLIIFLVGSSFKIASQTKLCAQKLDTKKVMVFFKIDTVSLFVYLLTCPNIFK